MARIACSAATEHSSRKRDIHHPMHHQAIAETTTRQILLQHRRGSRRTRCPLMPMKRGGNRKAVNSCRIECLITLRSAGDSQIDVARGRPSNDGLGEHKSDDHTVIDQILAEQ